MKITDRQVLEALKEYGSYQEIRSWMDKRQQMTMRDEFAANAMQASATNSVGAEGFTFEERAEWAYRQADAMLAERAK